MAGLTFLVLGPYLSPFTQRILSKPLDLSTQFVWWRQFGFQELAKGHLTLWNPHLFCGAPFFGGFQSALLYPPNWLFMVLPIPFAMNSIIALHVFLAGGFTYLWIIKRGSRPASALLASFIFMFSGAFFIRIAEGHLTNLCTMTWIPLIFLAIDGYRGERSWRWIFLGAFAVALQIFSGHVQYVYYTAVVAVSYVLLLSPRTKKGWEFLGGFFLMYLFAGLLSAVQLLTGWDAVGESVRAKGLSMDLLSMLDMNTERLAALFMPNFFGGLDDYWGGGIYYEGHPFVSLTGFALALYGLKASSHPDKKIFAGIGLFLTVLMLGTRTPLFPLFCKYFPLFASFRGVSKLNILVVVCLIVLAALGLDEIFKSPKNLSGLGKAAGWGSFIFASASAIFFLAPRMGGAKLFRQFLSHSDGMALQLFLAGALLVGLALFAYAGRKRELFRWGFLALALAELLVFAKANLSSFDFADLKQRTASVIQGTYDRDPGDYRVWVESGNYTLGTSGSDIWGEDPLIPYRYASFASASQQYDFNSEILRKYYFRNISPVLGLLRLRYIFRFVDGRLTVQRSGIREIPRSFLTDKWEIAEPEKILKRTTDPKFDPLQEVLLESAPGIEPQKAKMKGRVTLKDISTDRIEIQATLSKPAVLTLSDNYSKGWKAVGYPDSSESSYSVLPANGFMRALPLKAGTHHILLEYRPTLFVVGKWLSAASWSIFILILFWMVPFRRRS